MAPTTVDPESLFEELKSELIASKATAEAATPASENKDGEVITYSGMLGNRTNHGQLKLYDTHYWAGKPHPILTYPKIIPDSVINIAIRHEGTLPDGAKGGFAYADAYADASYRMWLFAFDYVNNKVFVRAGRARTIDWGEVEGLLDASSSKVDHKDPVLGGWASAEISDGHFFAGFRLIDHPSVSN